MLNYKPVNLTTITSITGGTTTFAKSYKFYDQKYPDTTLMYMLFTAAGFTDWKFDFKSIPEVILNRYRSFDDTGDGLYGFLQNYVSTAYDCVFTYDIENYEVSVHTKEELVTPSSVCLSFDNLLQQANITELSDEISTILAVKGSENMSLSRINPTGTNNIYNFDYYLGKYDYDGNQDDHWQDWIDENFSVTSVKFDDNGDIVWATSTVPAKTTTTFIDHVELWQQQIYKLIMSSNEQGSYAWLLKLYTYLNAKYVYMTAQQQYAEYIYNYCTEAISTYQEETKEVKKSSWLTILIGAGVALAVVAGVALAAFTGGVSLAAVGTALAGGGVAVAETLGLSGAAATIVGVAGQALFTAGVSTAFSGLLQLGLTTYQTNITKEEMQKYQDVAQSNLNAIRSGNGYYYNLTPSTITNLASGTYGSFVVDEPLYWVSGTYNSSSEDSIYQKVPTDSGVSSTTT